MAELPQRLGLPEKPHFGPAGLLETSAEALGRWERQLGAVMEELRAVPPGCGQTVPELAALSSGNRGEQQKDPFGRSPSWRGFSAGFVARRVMYGPSAELTYGFHGWDSRPQGGSGIIRAVAGEKQNQVWREGIGVFRN